MRAQGRQRRRGHGGGGPQEGAPVALEGHGDEHGQGAVLSAGEHGRLGLAQVRKRFDGQQIAAGILRGARLLGEELVGLLEGELAHGLQQRAQRPDVAGDVARPGLAGAGGGSGEDLVHRGAALELAPVGPKGVAGDNLGTCLDVEAVDGADLLRGAQVEEVGHHTRAGDASGLHHRAHAAVEEQEGLAS